MRLKKEKTQGQKLLKRLSLRQKFYLTQAAGIFLFCAGLLLFQTLSSSKQLEADRTSLFILQLLSLGLITVSMIIYSKSIVYRTLIRLKKISKGKIKKLNQNRKYSEKNLSVEIQKNPQM